MKDYKAYREGTAPSEENPTSELVVYASINWHSNLQLSYDVSRANSSL